VILSLIVLPLEVVFWLGFDVPIPWVFGLARAALLTTSWGRVCGPARTLAAYTFLHRNHMLQLCAD
jgi:hypothetical protein